MRARPTILLLLIAAVFLTVPTSVFAFTAEPESEDTVTTTFEPGMEPAVITPLAEEAEREDPWTSRYLAPVLLVGGVVVAIAYFAFYGARVRGKYEVVD